MHRVIDTRPSIVDLFMYTGDDLYLQLSIVDIEGNPEDLTGATGQAQIRATADATEILAEFETVVDANSIYLHLPAADAAALAGTTDAVWDAQVTYLDLTTVTMARGKVHITSEVTR